MQCQNGRPSSVTRDFLTAWCCYLQRECIHSFNQEFCFVMPTSWCLSKPMPVCTKLLFSRHCMISSVLFLSMWCFYRRVYSRFPVTWNKAVCDWLNNCWIITPTFIFSDISQVVYLDPSTSSYILCIFFNQIVHVSFKVFVSQITLKLQTWTGYHSTSWANQNIPISYWAIF